MCLFIYFFLLKVTVVGTLVQLSRHFLTKVDMERQKRNKGTVVVFVVVLRFFSVISIFMYSFIALKSCVISNFSIYI